jgi:hypothetical protein
MLLNIFRSKTVLKNVYKLTLHKRQPTPLYQALFYAFLLELPLAIFGTSYFVPSHFQFNAFWLAVLYCANTSFLGGILFFIYAVVIYAHFSGPQLECKTRPRCRGV